MNTKTMYETIMDLPLFKGVGADHVTSFLEKTGIEFHRFAPGDRIVVQGEPVRSLRFLLSGRIRLTTGVLNGKAIISSEFEGHDAIGATRLFGTHPLHEYSIEAIDNVSVMEFAKEKYVELLQSDSIYLMNFANLLSMNVHKASETVPHFLRLDFSRVLAEWLVLFTGRKSRYIRIDGIEAISEVYGKDFIKDNLDVLVGKSLVAVEGDSILVPNRDALIEYVIC
ncbi:MAG: cyclic nucleotide-binding domain-containing protein [Muribaculaceae bacterium]|nr:cyclic nucleotide-binding domain-containing protein [Muribaculaceae bacterium]